VILHALALAQAVTAPAAAPPEQDIVVIGRKLAAWRGKITTTPLGTRCVTRKSTGDREIDQVGCTAMERCWPAALPRMKAAHAKGVAEEERVRLQEQINADFAACAKPQREALVEELRARRAARTAGRGA